MESVRGYVFSPYIPRYSLPVLYSTQTQVEEDMQTITVRKDSLLQTLQDNRAAHRATFEKAIAGFREAAIAALEQRIRQLEAGKRVELYIRLDEPKDQTPDYDRVIAMLNWDTNNTVELTEKQFANYVQDKWGWTEEFTNTSNRYIAEHRL
jgi:hypothetical protein